VPGGVDDVERDATLRCPRARVPDRGVFRQDGDALFTLKIHRIQNPLGDILIGAKGACLPKHGIDQRGLSVVNVGDDGNVSQIFAYRHPLTLGAGTLYTKTV